MKIIPKGFMAGWLLMLLAASLFWLPGCSQGMTEEELKASVELVDIDTRWEKKYYQPWPPKLILVPAISFRIKNVGDTPLKYVYCNAIFKLEDENKNLGDNFVAGIAGDAVNPGETGEIISLQSFQGMEGQNLAHFNSNPAWRTAEVKIFFKSKGSQFVQVGQYKISRRINFTEPEPVGMEPKPQETIKK
ncbi:MAG: hypothetical protein ACERK6_04870 [Candidatus Aminicenantaceae bacterium]